MHVLSGLILTGMFLPALTWPEPPPFKSASSVQRYFKDNEYSEVQPLPILRAVLEGIFDAR